ncbi:hypothetical protein D3C80_787260 [compost metagenome]
MGVTGLQLPAWRQLTRDFGLEALGLGFHAHPGEGHVGVGRIAVVLVVLDRTIALMDLEIGKAGVDPAVKEFTLQTQFVVLPFVRVQQAVGTVTEPGVLGHEDIGVAGVQRVGVVEVIDRANVRYQAVVFLVVVLDPVVAVVDQAPAEQQGQVVGRVQACCEVGAVLAHLVVGARRHRAPVGFANVAVPVGEVRDVVVGMGDIAVVVALPARGGEGVADHQLMLAAEQLERPARIQVEGVAHGLAGVLLRIDAGGAVLAWLVALDRAERRVVAVDLVIELGLGHPAVVQVMLEAGEHGAGVLLPTAPFRRVVEVVRDIVGVAIAIVQRHGARPAGAFGVVVLVVGANGQQGVRVEVELEDAVVDAGLALVVIKERVLVLIGRHRPATHIGAVGQRAADVQFAAVVVPAAGAKGEVALELGGGLLAHQVDGGAQGACASQQSGSALEHFDAVVDGHVAEAVAGRVTDVARGRGNAVVLEVVDGKAARVVAVALGVIGRDGDARGVAHHVVDVVEAEVIHVLAGHHGDRLRRLARGQYQSCGGGNGAGGVGAALFGDGTQLVAGDLGGAEVDRTRLAHFPYQAVTPVRFLDHRQALAGEQGAQALLDPILAMQAFAALALGQRRVKRQHHSRLGGKTGQHLAKIVLPQVVAARGRFGLGHAQGQQQRATAQGVVNPAGSHSMRSLLVGIQAVGLPSISRTTRRINIICMKNTFTGVPLPSPNTACAG